MYRRSHTLLIVFAFALIASLNFLGFYLSSAAAQSEDGVAVVPDGGLWLGIPYVVSNMASNTVPAVRAPSIVSAPEEVAYVGKPYTYTLAISGYPTPTLSLEQGPDWMSIEDGALVWTPEAEGEYEVSIRAVNNVQPHAVQTFTLRTFTYFYWDPDMTTRFATLATADVEPGELYWRLMRAVWLDEDEAEGRTNISMEFLNERGERKIDTLGYVTWGTETVPDMAQVYWEAKPDEKFKWNWTMGPNLAPAYNAKPGGYPAEQVRGMGLGSIENPYYSHHASYELTWILDVNEAAANAP